MILGIGVDIVEVRRIADAISRHGDRFLRRVFTEREIEYCRGKRLSAHIYFAGKFAAKEAFSKALGTGIARGVRWRDVEILNRPSGEPYLVLHGDTSQVCEQMGGKNLFVSISHTDNYAVAVVVIEK